MRRVRERALGAAELQATLAKLEARTLDPFTAVDAVLQRLGMK
jgi:hypothetical protein